METLVLGRGSYIAFLRRGQVWISDPSGGSQKQFTFAALIRSSPRFSPDGSRIAYITLLNDERKRYRRLGPTDLWVVDIETTLSARLTAPAPDRIESVDWLDNYTLVLDRLEPDGFKSMLKTLSLR